MTSMKKQLDIIKGSVRIVEEGVLGSIVSYCLSCVIEVLLVMILYALWQHYLIYQSLLVRGKQFWEN